MTESTPGQRMLTFPSSALAAVHRAAKYDRSSAEAAALMRQIGFETGEGFLAAFTAWLEHHRQAPDADPTALAAEEFWDHLCGFFKSLGWGRLDFRQLHEGVGALTSAEWVEVGAVGSARQPSCHFTTGMLADLLSRLVAADLAVLEATCRSRGDDQCTFLLGSAEALQLVFDGMRQGRDLEAAVGGLM